MIGTIIGNVDFTTPGDKAIFDLISSSVKSGLGSIKVFEAYLLAKMTAGINPIELAINPQKITSPKSASKIPAAAMVREWVVPSYDWQLIPALML